MEMLESEAARLRDLAVGSTNACVTAKAVAASDPRVRELFQRRIQDGFRFRELRCELGSVVMVVFVFDAAPDRLCLLRPDFAAQVDSGRVSILIDPYTPSREGVDLTTADPTMQPSVSAVRVHADTVPFALAIPSNAPNVRVEGVRMRMSQAREAAFLRDRGIESLGSGAVASSTTPYVSPIGTVSTSNTPVGSPTATTSMSGGVADDTQPDSTTDFQVDTSMQTDYYDDTTNDDV